MKKTFHRLQLTTLCLLGLATFAAGIPTAYAQEVLPLSGPAFLMADAAYKAYARGDYRLAAEKAREALRLRPDAKELQSLLKKSEAARDRPPSTASKAKRMPRSRNRPLQADTPPAQADTAARRAFSAAEAAYKAYANGDYPVAIDRAQEAVRLARDNTDYRLMLINSLLAADRLPEADQAISAALALGRDEHRFIAQQAKVNSRWAEISQQQAQTFAAAAYTAFDIGDYAQAAADVRRALVFTPANADYQALLVNALYRAGQYPQAELAVSEWLATDSGNALLMAQRGLIRQRRGLDDLARQDFESAVQSGQLPVATEIGLLVDLGRKPEARLRFDAATAAHELNDLPDTEVAYLAARVGDDAQALAAFNRADASGKLPSAAFQDAAFVALRAHNDTQAIGFFRRAVDGAQAQNPAMAPQPLFSTRRALAEVSRETGVIASLSYRGAVSGLGLAPGAGTNSLQAGVEGYWRPWGYRNGQYAELFARAFQTLYSKDGGITGSDSLQGAVGIRYKPLSEQNLVTSFSRVFSPSGGRDDWLAQIGYSLDRGTDLRVDVASWWTTRASAEAGRYLSSGQNYALAELQTGKSFRMGDSHKRWVLFPHLSLAANYESTAAQRTGVGLGPGVTARYWFREDHYAAPRSYIDLSLQYRARLGGAERARGVFLTGTLSY